MTIRKEDARKTHATDLSSFISNLLPKRFILHASILLQAQEGLGSASYISYRINGQYIDYLIEMVK